DRYRVLALMEAFQRITGCLDRGHDLEVKTARIVPGQVLLDLLDQLGVVRALLVEPEDGPIACGTGARDGQLDPILNGGILRLAHAPDVAGLDLVFEQRRA